MVSEKPSYYFISSENESILFYRRIIAAKTNSTVASCTNKKDLLKQDLHSRLLYKETIRKIGLQKDRQNIKIITSLSIAVKYTICQGL